MKRAFPVDFIVSDREKKDKKNSRFGGLVILVKEVS